MSHRHNRINAAARTASMFARRSAVLLAAVASVSFINSAPAASDSIDGYHFDSVTDTHTPIIPAAAVEAAAADHAAAASDWMIAETSIENKADAALATLQAANDAALVNAAINTPVDTIIDAANVPLTMAAVTGAINVGERFIFQPPYRPGTWQVIGVTSKGYRMQQVSARDASKLVKGKTFTATPEEWDLAARA